MTELFSIAKRLRDIARVFSSDHDPVLVHNIRQGADRIDELEAELVKWQRAAREINAALAAKEGK